MESLIALIVTASAVSFWAIIVLLFCFIVLSLGVFKGIHAGSVLFFVFAALLYIRFDPSLVMTLAIFAVWFVIGLLYARGRWKLQITKLKNRVIEAWDDFPSKKAEFLKDRAARLQAYEKEVADIKADTSMSEEKRDDRLSRLETDWKRNEPERCKKEEQVIADLENCELDEQSTVQWREGDDQSAILKKFRPMFSKYRGTIAAWAVAWPLYLIKDFTIDLVKNALELLRGNFQKAADKAFS